MFTREICTKKYVNVKHSIVWTEFPLIYNLMKIYVKTLNKITIESLHRYTISTNF